MGGLKTPLEGVKKDFNGRLACYKKDWLDAFGSGARSAFSPCCWVMEEINVMMLFVLFQLSS